MTSLVFASALLAVIGFVSATEYVPNSYVMEVGQACGSSCRDRIARSQGTDCTVKPLGTSRRGANWLEVTCRTSASSLTESSLMESAAAGGVPVRSIEKNQIFTIMDLWGADEVDGSDGDGERCPSSALGEDVIISVHDTGCTPKGSGFEGIKCRNFVEDGRGENFCGDSHGHGTHVAGTAASGFYGVAPRASVSCIRVLGADGSGTMAGIINALSTVADWSRANMRKKVVINMSLGGSRSNMLNDAVTDAIEGSNLIFALAAGNSNRDSRDFSPASASDGKRIYGVGAHDSRGRKASFSNYGLPVQISAPGVQIMSTVPGGFKKYSGTSMACPHVAGAIAAIWSSGEEPSLENLTQGGEVRYSTAMKPKLNYLCQRTSKRAFSETGKCSRCNA